MVRERSSSRGGAREADVSAEAVEPQGAVGDAAAQAPPPRIAPAHSLVDILPSVRPGWNILRWRKHGEGDVIRSNVNIEFLRLKTKTPNLVMRELYEWQILQLEQGAPLPEYPADPEPADDEA